MTGAAQGVKSQMTPAPKSGRCPNQTRSPGLSGLRENPSKLSFRMVMGQWPTHRNESQDVTPAKSLP
jgi:hypothetical protein